METFGVGGAQVLRSPPNITGGLGLNSGLFALPFLAPDLLVDFLVAGREVFFLKLCIFLSLEIGGSGPSLVRSSSLGNFLVAGRAVFFLKLCIFLSLEIGGSGPSLVRSSSLEVRLWELAGPSLAKLGSALFWTTSCF